MLTITSNQNPLPFLQQRIIYAEQHIVEPIYFVENVPCREDKLAFTVDSSSALSYCSSQGLPVLIEAILKRELNRYQLQVQYEQTMITNGGLHALSLVFKLLSPGKAKVLCQGPVFSGVSEILINNNYEITYIPDELTEDQLIDFLKQQTNINFVYINIPNNPTGKIYSRPYLDLLIKYVQNNSAKLVVDLVYDDFVFTENHHFNPLAFLEQWDQVFTINSFSKNWGLPGLRLGWVISHEDNILKLVALLSSECVCVNPMTQGFAVQAIELGNQMLIDKVVRGKKLVEFIWASNNKIKINNPEGGTQIYARFPVDNIDDFADYMLLNHKLVLTTSSNYVMSDNQSIRIPIGCSLEMIRKSLNLLTLGLDLYLHGAA